MGAESKGMIVSGLAVQITDHVYVCLDYRLCLNVFRLQIIFMCVQITDYFYVCLDYRSCLSLFRLQIMFVQIIDCVYVCLDYRSCLFRLQIVFMCVQIIDGVCVFRLQMVFMCVQIIEWCLCVFRLQMVYLPRFLLLPLRDLSPALPYSAREEMWHMFMSGQHTHVCVRKDTTRHLTSDSGELRQVHTHTCSRAHQLTQTFKHLETKRVSSALS